MKQQECPGLLASVPHQWLAAIGATVLNEHLRLSWTDEPNPCATLHSPHQPPVELLHSAWPSEDDFAQLPIVEWNLNNQQDIPLADFRRMTTASLADDDAWMLAAAATDLAPGKRSHCAARGPLNPGTQGSSSPQEQILKMLSCTAKDIADALDGVLPAKNLGGLCLDPRRFVDPQGKMKGVRTVYPIEVLAYYGLALFPLRGDGIIDKGAPRQRGWVSTPRGEPRLKWPAWRQPLDRWAIDALLDAWNPERPTSAATHGITSAWESVRITHPGKIRTYGYSSRPLRTGHQPERTNPRTNDMRLY